MTRDHRATDHDALSEFASEPVPPPATSEFDALIDAASAGAPAAFPSEADRRPSAARAAANDRWRWTVGVSTQPIIVRWVAAPLAAFVVGAALVGWTLRAIEPVAPSIARATPPAQASETAPPAIDGAQPTTSVTTAQPVSVPAPPVQAPVIEADIAAAPPAAAAPPRVATPATVTAQNVQPAEAPAAPAPLLPPPAPVAFDARAVLPSAITEPPPIAPTTSKLEIAAGEFSRPSAAAPSSAATAVFEERAVRETLEHYADAFAGMDVQATAAVWPSVDRRALTRAFATLKSQGLTFNSCNIDVNEVNATAHCRGTVKFVRKIGNPTPLTAPQEWRFVMRKLGATWTIEEVSATRNAAASARASTGS